MVRIIFTDYYYLISKLSPQGAAIFNNLRNSLNDYFNNGVNLESENNDELIRRFVRAFCKTTKANNEQTTNYANLMRLSKYAIEYERNINGFDPNIPNPEMPNEPIIDDATIIDEVSHYKYLLTQLNEDDDEYTFYSNKIRELEGLLTLTRRRKNDSTKN